MKSKLTLLFFIATAFANQLNANQAIITGTVSLSDKIKLNKITVQALNTENKIVTKTTTNTQGKFTLKKLENNTFYIIELKSTGYKQTQLYYIQAKSVDSAPSYKLQMKTSITIKNKEFIVYEKKSNTTSETVIAKKTIKNIATAGAFTDISSSIKLLPGVISDDAKGAAIYARGGNTTETIGIMDDIYLPYPYFWNGFLTVFNPLITHEYTFYNGGFNANYGNAISGILYVKNDYIAPKKLTSEIDLNFSEFNSVIKGPLKKKYSFWNLSFRKSYYDKTVANLQKKIDNIKYPYLDNANLILSTPINTKTTIRYNYYYFKDGMDFSNNQTEAIKYALDNVVAFKTTKHINAINIKQKLFKKAILNSTISYSDQHNFFNKYNETILTKENILFDYNLYKTGYKSELKYLYKNNNNLTTGIEKTHFESYKNTTITEKKQFQVNYEAAYITNKTTFALKKKTLTLNYGLRAEKFPNSDPIYISPRIATKLNLSNSSSIGYRYGIYYQKNLSIINYLEFTYPNAKAEKGIHTILSVEKTWNKKIKTSLEFYYKDYENLIQKGEVDNLLLKNIQITNLNNTIGYAKGIDIYCELLKTKDTNLSGWISYSYLETKRKNNLLPEIGYYYTDWDQRHTISTYITKKLDSDWQGTLKLLIGSGKPYSSSKTTINDKRKKITPNLDIWFTKNKIDLLHKYSWIKSSQFNIGVANILNRKSFLVETDASEDEELTLLPLSPILAISIKF
jgi:hypothetical protein